MPIEPVRSGDPITVTAWLDEDSIDAPPIEGDEVQIHAQLTDVDEVAVVIEWFNVEPREMLVHMSRVQAIALAGQIAWAATASPAALPHGHGPDGAMA